MGMRKAVSLFMSAAVIIAGWWWLGKPVAMPASPLDPGEKLYCISYAPFHGFQTPLDLSTKIDPAQIDRDLALLSQFTDCIRTYSVDFGLEHVPEIAQRHGLKVLLGLWVSSHADRTQYQISTGVDLARKYPAVIRALVVGNEALLRREVSPLTLAETIRDVKSRVPVPVTYADVWEFWLRHRELASAVDFVTIHILPYWEDDPIAARNAADHVEAIRRRVVASFPGKEVVIGEVGWPSAGRMREAALPSPANQALVLAEVLARGKREHFHVNVIEAFDQPWKRYLEGTVGGHWGLFDDATRQPKFHWGEPVSNHPRWPWQAGGGVVLAGLVFAATMLGRRKASAAEDPGILSWLAIALNALVAGMLIGWTIENAAIESLGISGWLHSVAFAALAVIAPVAGGVALARPGMVPTFAQMIGAKPDRQRDRLELTIGFALMALTVLAIEVRIGAGFRSALPRLSVRTADRCGDAIPAAGVCPAAPGWPLPDGRKTRRRRLAAVRDIHCVERDPRQLAGAMVRRRPCDDCGQPCSGAGRARLRISKATAKADNATL